jgi:hypothetical protein
MLLISIGFIERKHKGVTQNLTVFRILVKNELENILYQWFWEKYTKLDNARNVAGVMILRNRQTFCLEVIQGTYYAFPGLSSCFRGKFRLKMAKRAFSVQISGPGQLSP